MTGQHLLLSVEEGGARSTYRTDDVLFGYIYSLQNRIVMKHLYRGCLVVGFLPVIGATAQISVDPLPSTTLCANTSVDVAFQASGTFDPGNVFTVELSDASGSFAVPSAIGSISATTSSTVSCPIPVASGTGFRIRVNSSSPIVIGDDSGTDLTIAAPNAGGDAIATVCSSGTPLALFSVLNGSPDVGGIWSDPNATGALIGGMLNLGGLVAGTYSFIYTVDLLGCTDDATVTVNVLQAPNAGVNASMVVCSNDPPFSMWGQLGGSAGAGGQWTAPTANPVPDVFDPAVDMPGIYTYVVSGTPPCANAVSTLLIIVNQAPNAGTNSAITWCASAGAFTLFDQLVGAPQAGGTWTFNAMPHGPIFLPGTDLPGNYVYMVPGSAPCLNSTAQLSVTIGACLTTPQSYNAQQQDLYLEY